MFSEKEFIYLNTIFNCNNLFFLNYNNITFNFIFSIIRSNLFIKVKFFKNTLLNYFFDKKKINISLSNKIILFYSKRFFEAVKLIAQYTNFTNVISIINNTIISSKIFSYLNNVTTVKYLYIKLVYLLTFNINRLCFIYDKKDF